MNWSVELAPGLKRTSLILTGRTFRTRWLVVSDCVLRVAASVHSALPARKPAPEVAGEVILKVALTLAPGPTGLAMVFGSLPIHPAGTDMLNLTPAAVDPVVFVNVAVTSSVDPGVNVVTRDRVTRATSYLAATMLACTASVVASVGYPVVITP